MRKENIKNEVAARERNYKLINWGVHAPKIEAYLQSVAARASEEKYFERLYVSRDNNEHQVQLFAGTHPIGSVEITRDPLGREIGRRVHTEHGAALVISQSTLGDVGIILYPYSSEKLKQGDEYIVWDICSDPTKLSDSLLSSAVSDFFCYIRVSSALFSESIRDRFRIRYLSFRGKRYIGGGGVAKLVFSHWSWVLLSAIGSGASIYSLLK